MDITEVLPERRFIAARNNESCFPISTSCSSDIHPRHCRARYKTGETTGKIDIAELIYIWRSRLKTVINDEICALFP